MPYNSGIMKVIVKVSDIAKRHHRALFDRNLPFRARQEQRQDLYKRKPKHRKDDRSGNE